MSLFLDTNVLINHVDTLDSGMHYYISDITLMELENIKTQRTKDEKTKYGARRAINWIDQNGDHVTVICQSNGVDETLAMFALPKIPDYIICASAYYVLNNFDPELVFCSEDICCRTVAESILNIPVLKTFDSNQSFYKGYQIIRGNTEDINEQMQDLHMVTNEYLIIENTDESSQKEMRWDGEKFVALSLPPSKYVKAKNSLQRCALDILNNPKITIAAINGGYGSGKTYLSMRMALYSVKEKGWQSKILGVREAAGEGREVGFLPGELEAKTEAFFQPLAQQLDGGEFELERLKQSGILESNIPFYLKGTTYNETVIVVDEAEDLSEKQIRLIGTRLGQNSRIFFSGDYKQSVFNSTEDNALVNMCNIFKGNPMFGCIYLGEDVRSETSKMFANLFE